jgi:DNA-binding transcriptional MerR regulator
MNRMSIEKRYYRIGEVCEMLNCKEHNLRQIEDALKIPIARNSQNQRLYTEQNIETFKTILRLRQEKKLPLATIAQMMEFDQPKAMQKLMPQNVSVLVEAVTEAVNNQMQLLTEDLREEIQELRRENQELLIQLDRRFTSVDEQLAQWREQQKQKKPWYARLFPRKKEEK